jgi:radical SAM superfamily enzyme YgiQ (UPF0313 family)
MQGGQVPLVYLQSLRLYNIFLANPAPAAERIHFSFITPRALPVLAAVTPAQFVERTRLVDQTVEEFPFAELRPGDLVGISIHTFNAIHGYELARKARASGSTVVFGGPHASIFPEEALRYGDAVVTGDAESVWGKVLEDYSQGCLQSVYRGGRVSPEYLTPARWDLLRLERYLVGTIQTVRGCPKQCSFCSVWVQDGRIPRVRANDAILQEVQHLYQAGFRLVMFADDNFYPYTRADIEKARSGEERKHLDEGLAQRFELLERLATEIPGDMFFCTQITMEVADDPEYLAAMRRARIAGALIGIESITEEGLKATNKYFNSTGAELVRKLETIRTQGFPYIFGAFIFGIESDTADTLKQTIRFARDSGIALAQFIQMTPLPGTVDFSLMRKGRKALNLKGVDYAYWLDPNHPRILYHHPYLKEEEILQSIEEAWRDFYSYTSIAKRAWRFGLFTKPKKLLTYLVICRGLLTRYRRYGLSADSAVRGTKRKLATLLGRAALSLMKGQATRRQRLEPSSISSSIS